MIPVDYPIPICNVFAGEGGMATAQKWIKRENAGFELQNPISFIEILGPDIQALD